MKHVSRLCMLAVTAAVAASGISLTDTAGPAVVQAAAAITAALDADSVKESYADKNFDMDMDTANLIQLYDKGELTSAQKQSVINSILSLPANDNEIRLWLQQLAASTVDLQIEQMIDQQLVFHHGDRAAAERLYKSGTEAGFVVPLHGMVEKFLVDAYPSGALAEGIRLYESIRGKPYFYSLDEQWYSAEGNDYANPAQAIVQWSDFIERFPKHPAADDAAYRLARCYQLAGDGENALYWFHQAVESGDRDLNYDARGMLLFVLDVEMTPEQLAAVETDRLPSWMKPWIDYSQAVEYIRTQQYQEAAALLHAFIETYGGKDLFGEAYSINREDNAEVTFPEDKYPYWEKISGQLRLIERAALLAEKISQSVGTEQADRQYELAALIYKEPLFYYNHLWRETRQSFFWFGHIKEMDYYEPLDRYIGRFNHLIQAIDQFTAIDLQHADKQTAAKTLFSIALSYSKLTYFGEEVSFYLPGSRLNEQVVKYAKQLVDSYPQSGLADDALMLMYAHTKDKQWLEQITAAYPEGDQATEAQKKLETAAVKESSRGDSPYPPYEPGFSVRYERLGLDDSRLTPAVKMWMGEHRESAFHGIKEDGDWVYVLVSADKGKTVDYMTIGSKNFQMTAAWQQRAADSDTEKPGMMLARVKKKFVHAGDWAWNIYSQ